MKKIVFAMALLIFLTAVSYASSSTDGSDYKHRSGAKGSQHILHPVDHFII